MSTVSKIRNHASQTGSQTKLDSARGTHAKFKLEVTKPDFFLWMAS